MKWKNYKIEKPQKETYCFVTNKKRGVHCWLAFYNPRSDYFSFSDPRYEGMPIEITHYIELPFPCDIKE